MSDQESKRDLGEEQAAAAAEALREAVDAKTYGEQQAKRQEGSTMLLLAIYHELRHGHDQQAAQNEAIKKLTHDLGELTAELGMLRSSILGNQ